MSDDRQDRSKQPDSVEPPDPGDIADAAQIQMPGKPPNLAFDPSKRNKQPARVTGKRAPDEDEKLSGKDEE
ncbi:MAG TPA: hypothetical protein VN681_06980 [Stellaceae bacterium]|nr:hypothetical protein [Stellaceae bacterium]